MQQENSKFEEYQVAKDLAAVVKHNFCAVFVERVAAEWLTKLIRNEWTLKQTDRLFDTKRRCDCTCQSVI